MTYSLNPEKGLEGCCEFFIVRHGLTDYNVERRLQGQLDVPLNDEGRDQCRKCGAELQRMIQNRQGFTIDAIYSSPLQRARESAEIIQKAAGIPCEIVVDSRIQEWNAGILQGHLLSEVKTRFPKEWEAWNQFRDPSYDFPEGESLQHRFDRVKEFFLHVAARHVGQRILVVTHGGVLDDLYRLARDIPINIITNAPKINAQIHEVKAHVKAPRRDICNDCCSPTKSASASTDADVAQVDWEIVSWSRPPKTSQQQKENAGCEAKEIPVESMEYA